MKCERCHAPIKPVVAIDIDGTLGDYHNHFIQFASEYIGIGRPMKIYDGSINFGDWVIDQFKLADRRTYRDIKLAYRQGAQKRSMPMFEGARALVLGVRGAGADLWLTTSRPYMRLDNVDPDTRAWLERYGLRYDHLLYDDNKYKVLSCQVDPERVVAVLDDLGSMYDSAAVEFGPAVPILRKTQFNAAVRRPRMTAELDSARQMITAHIEDWKIKHNFDDLPQVPAA